jgi:nicotinamide riboside kinase
MTTFRVGRPHFGWFVTIEGPDGSGKTLLAERLQARAARLSLSAADRVGLGR